MLYRFKDVKVKIADSDFLGKIPLENINLYLENNGWKLSERIARDNKEIGSGWTKKKNDNTVYYIALPADQTFLDYPSRVYDAITVLEESEGENQLCIVDDICNIKYGHIAHKDLKMNLLSWNFESAAKCLDGTEPEYTQHVIKALSVVFGEDQDFAGNMTKIIWHALAYIGAIDEDDDTEWAYAKAQNPKVINRLFNWDFKTAQSYYADEHEEVRALIDALAATFENSGDFSAKGQLGVIVEAAVANIGGYSE